MNARCCSIARQFQQGLRSTSHKFGGHLAPFARATGTHAYPLSSAQYRHFFGDPVYDPDHKASYFEEWQERQYIDGRFPRDQRTWWAPEADECTKKHLRPLGKMLDKHPMGDFSDWNSLLRATESDLSLWVRFGQLDELHKFVGMGETRLGKKLQTLPSIFVDRIELNDIIADCSDKQLAFLASRLNTEEKGIFKDWFDLYQSSRSDRILWSRYGLLHEIRIFSGLSKTPAGKWLSSLPLERRQRLEFNEGLKNCTSRQLAVLDCILENDSEGSFKDWHLLSKCKPQSLMRWKLSGQLASLYQFAP